MKQILETTHQGNHDKLRKTASGRIDAEGPDIIYDMLTMDGIREYKNGLYWLEK